MEALIILAAIALGSWLGKQKATEGAPAGVSDHPGNHRSPELYGPYARPESGSATPSGSASTPASGGSASPSGGASSSEPAPSYGFTPATEYVAPLTPTYSYTPITDSSASYAPVSESPSYSYAPVVESSASATPVSTDLGSTPNVYIDDNGVAWQSGGPSGTEPYKYMASGGAYFGAIVTATPETVATIVYDFLSTNGYLPRATFDTSPIIDRNGVTWSLLNHDKTSGIASFTADSGVYASNVVSGASREAIIAAIASFLTERGL